MRRFAHVGLFSGLAIALMPLVALVCDLRCSAKLVSPIQSHASDASQKCPHPACPDRDSVPGPGGHRCPTKRGVEASAVLNPPKLSIPLASPAFLPGPLPSLQGHRISGIANFVPVPGALGGRSSSQPTVLRL